jgi:hypothetical protein
MFKFSTVVANYQMWVAHCQGLSETPILGQKNSVFPGTFVDHECFWNFLSRKPKPQAYEGLVRVNGKVIIHTRDCVVEDYDFDTEDDGEWLDEGVIEVLTTKGWMVVNNFTH